MRFWVKVYKVYYRGFLEKVVAICDEELLGKKFEEGKIQLYVDPKFYKGDLVDEKELEKILEDSTIINAVGKKSVEILIKMGLVDKRRVLYIKGIPHAQVIIIR